MCFKNQLKAKATSSFLFLVFIAAMFRSGVVELEKAGIWSYRQEEEVLVFPCTAGVTTKNHCVHMAL